MRVAVISPYYKEPEAWLARCIQSVRDQTVEATHFVVAGAGFPQDWVDEAGVRHIKLDRPHGDYGNTPRTIGAMLAVSEGFDAVAFLDGDNWYAPDHIESCVEMAARGDVDYIYSKRQWARADGSVMNVHVQEDEDGSHVDTNCHFLMRGAFHTIPRWGLMPKRWRSGRPLLPRLAARRGTHRSRDRPRHGLLPVHLGEHLPRDRRNAAGVRQGRAAGERPAELVRRPEHARPRDRVPPDRIHAARPRVDRCRRHRKIPGSPTPAARTASRATGSTPDCRSSTGSSPRTWSSRACCARTSSGATEHSRRSVTSRSARTTRSRPATRSCSTASGAAAACSSRRTRR